MDKIEITREAKALCLEAQECIQSEYDNKEAIAGLSSRLNDAGRHVTLAGANPKLLTEISRYANRAQLILKGSCFLEITKTTFREPSNTNSEAEIVGTRSTSYRLDRDYLNFGLRAPFADLIDPAELAIIEADAQDRIKGVIPTEICDAVSINFRKNDSRPETLPLEQANTQLLRSDHLWFCTESEEELTRRAQGAPNGIHAQRKKALGLFWRLDQLYGEILATAAESPQGLPHNSMHFLASIQGSKKIANGERPQLEIAGQNVSAILGTETRTQIDRRLSKTVRQAKDLLSGRQKLLSVAETVGTDF